MSATTEIRRELTSDALRPVLGARFALKARHLAVCLWISLLFVFFNYMPLTQGAIWGHALEGKWILEPQKIGETLFFAEINHSEIRKERQNFDPSGHYSRPDIFSLKVDSKRQNLLDHS